MKDILNLIEQSYTMYENTRDERYKKIWYALVNKLHKLYHSYN
jgi:hypothetical protein